MVRLSTLKQKFYSTTQAAHVLNVTCATVRNLAKRGELASSRDRRGCFVITAEAIIDYAQRKKILIDDRRQDIVFISAKAPGYEGSKDLEAQRHIVNNYVATRQTKELVEIVDYRDKPDIQRAGLQQLIELIIQQKVNKIFVLDETFISIKNIHGIRVLLGKYGGCIERVPAEHCGYLGLFELDSEGRIRCSITGSKSEVFCENALAGALERLYNVAGRLASGI